MAENRKSGRSLQFQCADLLSREAASRTTWHRILKKHKAEENVDWDATSIATDQFVAVYVINTCNTLETY